MTVWSCVQYILHINDILSLATSDGRGYKISCLKEYLTLYACGDVAVASKL